MADVERDDWGFSDADHAEFRALMQRHQARLPEVMLAVMSQGGVTPEPDDPGMMGWIARTTPDDGTSRVFPKGGLWWSLLDGLRAIDAEKGGA